MIVGSGVDLVEIARLERVVDRRGAAFERRVCTAREVEMCHRSRRPTLALALRFAAKEAALKAVGTGWGDGVDFRDVEVLDDPGGGAPRIVLGGAAGEIARARGDAVAHLALARSRRHAMALVLLEVRR